MGSDTAGPTSPEGDKSYDGRVADREFGISPDERNAIDLHGEMLRSDKPLQIPGHPELNSAPIFIQILKKYPDGSAHVKVKTSLSNRQKTLVPNGGDPIHLKNQGAEPEIRLSRDILDQIRYGSLEKPDGGGMVPPPPGAPGAAPPPPGGM